MVKRKSVALMHKYSPGFLVVLEGLFVWHLNFQVLLSKLKKSSYHEVFSEFVLPDYIFLSKLCILSNCPLEFDGKETSYLYDESLL